MDSGLLSQHLVPDFLPAFPAVGSLPHDHLVCYHPDCVVVSRHPVIIMAHHLRRHIPRRPAAIPRVLWPPVPGNPKVGQVKVPLPIKHQILRLNIPMNYRVLMDIRQPQHQACDSKSHLPLTPDPIPDQVVPEVATALQLHDQVQAFAVLKSADYVDEEGVPQHF